MVSAFFCVLFFVHIFDMGVQLHTVIPGCIWLLYRYKYNIYCIEVGYMHLPTKWYNYLMRPESAKLDAWGCLCYSLQERELHLWGIIWSVITLEFLPKRNNELTTYHWNAFSYPRWDFVGWLWFKQGDPAKFLVFTFYCKIYTFWSTFFGTS